MPLPDERPRPSVANLIGKFETTSQKRNSTSSTGSITGAPGSSTTAPLPRKPSTGTEGATSPHAIAQQLTGNDSSADGASAPARKHALGDTPTTDQEDAGSGMAVSTPAPTDGEDAAKCNDGTQLSLSDLKVPDVQEVPPTPLTEQPDAPPGPEEPAPTTSLEPAAAPFKKPPASPKKPATSLAKPTTARPRPSTTSSSTSKPLTATPTAPKPKPSTGSMGRPPSAAVPRAPRPSATSSSAAARPSSTVRTTITTPKTSAPKPSTAPKPASTTPATSSTTARKTPTRLGSTLTPGAAPAHKTSTSSLRPSAVASSSTPAAAPGAASLRKSVSGKPVTSSASTSVKPATSSTSTSTKPATGTTSTIRRPATGTTPSNTATRAAGARRGVTPRVGLVGAGRDKGKATTAAATQKAGTPGDKGKAAAVSTEGIAVATGAEKAEPEGEAKAEEVLVEGSQVVSIELSSEEPNGTPEGCHEGHVEVLASEVGSQEEDGSAPVSPPVEGEEIHYAEESMCEEEAAPSLRVSGSDYEQPDQEEHESPQLSGEQQELLTDDAPEPSEEEEVAAAAHPGAEEHLEKAVPPYQPPVLPIGDLVNEAKRETMDGMPDEA